MFKGKYGTYWINEGILFIDYKSDLTISLKVAKRIVRDRMEFQQNKEYPVFCNLNGIVGLQSEARHYFAREGTMLMNALALHSTSPVAIRLTEFYLKIHNHRIPTQIFTHKNFAINFLRPYIR